MSKDFSTKQPAPQKRDSTQFDAQESGEPTTGFTQAPRVGLPATGAGPGKPASNRKIR
jgi:hypothetical protein